MKMEWDFGFPREILGDEVRLTKEQRKWARKSAWAMDGFRWAYTKEGEDYWYAIYHRLCQMAEEGR